MFFILFLILLLIFLILAISSIVIINNAIDRHIKDILKKHNCTLISISNTHKTFRHSNEPTKPTWKNFGIMGYSTAQTTTFKQVSFNTSDNKKITSLVAIDSLFLLSHKIFFEVNLDTL